MTQQELAEIILRYGGQDAPGLPSQVSNLTGGTLKNGAYALYLGVAGETEPGIPSSHLLRSSKRINEWDCLSKDLPTYLGLNLSSKKVYGAVIDMRHPLRNVA